MVKLAKANQQAQKKKAPPPKQVEEEEDSSEEDSSEEEETPPAKVSKKVTPAKAKPAVKNGVKAKQIESDDEDDSEESSEEEAPPPKKTPAKTTPAKAKTPAKVTPAKADESEDDDDDDDDDDEEEAPPPKKTAKKGAKLAAKPPAKPPVKGKPTKESSDDEDDSEEEAPPPKKATPAKSAAKAAAKTAAEDSSDDDDSEEEAPPPKKTPPAKQAAKPAAKAQPAEESSEEEDDDDEDESEEEMDTTPAPAATKGKKAGMVKAKEESEEEEDDDDEEEEEDDDDDDEEEEEAAVKPGKRKAESKKETPPAKKAKSDGEGFSLFVGNLNANKDFDEIKDALRKFFTKNKVEVTDVRLGKSKRFGYVDFASEEDLNTALELNGKKMMGQELKLDKARSKENSQEDKKERDARTLFVKNLPYSATADDLKELFDSAVDVRLPLGQNGSNRGIAYIEFKTEAEAEKMLESAQGADLQGRSIMVDYVGDKSQKGARISSGGVSKTLVVNNLSFSATEEVLQSTFEKAVSVRVPQRDGRPKGFAFVEFDNADDAKEALDNFNHTEIEGRSIRLEFSQNSGGRDGGRGNSGPTKTLFVKGLCEDTTDQTLKDSFEAAVAARIVTDRDTGASKGFGFVDFDNENDCKAAKEAMEDGEIDGNKVTLDYAKPKGEGGFRGGRGGGGGGRGGFRGGRGGFGGRGGGRGGGGRGGRGGGRGGFGGGRGGGFGAKPQGKKIKFDD